MKKETVQAIAAKRLAAMREKKDDDDAPAPGKPPMHMPAPGAGEVKVTVCIPTGK